MKKWLDNFKYDPIKPLLDSNNPGLIYFCKRDLLEEKVDFIENLWPLPYIHKILKKQNLNGTWTYKGKKLNLYPKHHYPLIATFKVFRILVEKYEFEKSNSNCKKAAEYILSCQTADGDIRGMIGNQYATYYTGYILSLLIKAGYTNDLRVIKGLDWLLNMRQDDGAWNIPILTHRFDKVTINKLTSKKVQPVEPDRSKPFSHNWTNMVLQGFAVHPEYKKIKEIKRAGELLKSRFFKNDFYHSYRSAYYWIRFRFWWPNILTALDSLERIGFTKNDSDIKLGLEWFISHQQEDGLWKIENNPNKKELISQKVLEKKLWLTLNVCRIFKRYYE